eukprot:TRINITY_DN769_c0_g1_i1.p1 TRINITY_DN769_c0_g1~~TRINITY_DN769_c0_g1_i1.p1  ORF type:complete len:771 (-),score=129.97 TRINITY_DN769_c0_g1_i1:87-2399(-)
MKGYIDKTHRMLGSLVPYLVLVFVALYLSPAVVAQTTIQSNQTVSSTVSDGGNLYRITDGVNDNALVEIVFTITDDSNNNGDNVYLSVSDQNFAYLGDVIARTVDNDYITTICPSSDGTTTSYYFAVQGTPGAGFSLTVRLYDAELLTGETVYEQTIDGPAYYFINVDRTDAPLEATVHSNDGSTEAVLQGTFQQCPPFDETSRSLLTVPGVKTAWLTFSEKGRLSFSKVDPTLQRGRWYFAVYGRSTTINKRYSLSIDYGLDYDQYYAPQLVPLFLFPIAMFAVIAFPFFVTLFLNKTRGLKKVDPRIGREDEEIIVPQRTDYLPFTVICGIFFFVPALQAAARAANDARDEGDRDQCYYNDFCAKPDDSFAAANNIWSNLGYMWAGAILLVYFFVCKQIFGFRYLTSRDVYVVFAISVSIILIGMLSLTYHICPTRQLFQFDTSFMFVTAGLLMVELFRKYFHKHPYPWVPFALFAFLFVINFLAALVDVTGTYDGYTQGLSGSNRANKRYIYRACLTAWIIAVLGFLFYFVYLKPKRKWGEEKHTKWDDKEGGWKRFYNRHLRPIMKRFARIRVFHPLRLLTLLIWFVIMILIIWARPDSDLSQTLLYIMVISFLWFLFAYLFHKLRVICAYICCRRESTRKRAEYSWLAAVVWLYLGIGTLLVWIMALIFFTILSASDKAESPAKSREMADECLIWDYYDSHDFWHYMSAAGLLLGALFVFHNDVMEGPLPKEHKKNKKNSKKSKKNSSSDDEHDEELAQPTQHTP